MQTLERLGHDLDYPEELTCCGQPAFNSGYWDEAREKAGLTVDESDFGEYIVQLRRAEFQLLNDPREMEAKVCQVAAKEAWKRVASHSGELTDRVCAALDLPRILTDREYDVRELEACDAGISECEALIAQTGSVLVSNRGCRRTTSFLPAGHNSSPTCPPRSRI